MKTVLLILAAIIVYVLSSLFRSRSGGRVISRLEEEEEFLDDLGRRREAEEHDPSIPGSTAWFTHDTD